MENHGEKALLEAMLARAVADMLYLELSKRKGLDESCPIYVAELKDFMLLYPRVAKRIKALRSNKELKRCLKKIEKMMSKP